ncbi:MAG: HlyD family secretion protein [Crocinitomicaceae bacterium]|nr:HlyD family secretion protein [Crocinitomicaceae bacterium]
MLNISRNSVSSKINISAYSALRKVEMKTTRRVILRIILWTAAILFIIAMLPWTQNVRTSGSLTTLNPEQRPQEIHSVISGRVEKWMAKEGDFVKKGDTIIIISEVKDAYFDDQLLERTENQLGLKKQSVDAYSRKIEAQNRQLDALFNRRDLESNKTRVKIEQVKLKIQNDSIAYEASIMDNSIAQYQLQRMDSLYTKGLKSLADLEKRKLKAQQTNAKQIAANNKWRNSKNELLNLRIELNNIYAKFESDGAKVLSDKFTTETNKFDAESTINKLENQYSNYEERQSLYVIKAPQDGYVTKIIVQGIGETIKEGAAILSFMPKEYDLTAEVYVDPIDLPLMHIGEHVRLQFDGWPAIVFSGWPSASHGTYGGEIYAIDQFISKNGKYRILIKPDKKDYAWPKELRVGGGAKVMILLNDVPVWYELWRNINGFPPEYYQPTSLSKTDIK